MRQGTCAKAIFSPDKALPAGLYATQEPSGILIRVTLPLLDNLGELPTVSVTITEHDYTQETIDPAAETELTLLLQQLGFKVVQPGQGQKSADIAISGEAFSEIGSFHGNLVSGRARIEMKMTRAATQDLIAADRETQIAMAVGARTAGKDALQKAADKLIERLLPKLVK